MFKKIVFGLVTGLFIATTTVADNVEPNKVAQGMAPNMGSGMNPGMMAPHMGRNIGPGMMQGGKPMMPGMRNPQGAGPFAGVQFNEKQRKMIREMMEKERKSNQQRIKAMKAAQEKLQKVYMSEKWDVKEINKIYEEIFAEQKKTIAAMAKARNEVYELMTKEQKAQMKKMQEMQQARMQQMQEARQKRIEQMRSRRQQQPAAQQ